MFTTTLDILYMSLAVGFILISIFLCIALLYLTLILRDVNKVTERARETADKVQDYLLKPIAMATHVISKLEPVVHTLKERAEKAVKKKK